LAFKINGNRGAQQEICFNKSFKKLYHFNRNFQFKSVIYKMIQLDIRSRTKNPTVTPTRYDSTTLVQTPFLQCALKVTTFCALVSLIWTSPQ